MVCRPWDGAGPGPAEQRYRSEGRYIDKKNRENKKRRNRNPYAQEREDSFWNALGSVFTGGGGGGGGYGGGGTSGIANMAGGAMSQAINTMSSSGGGGMPIVSVPAVLGVGTGLVNQMTGGALDNIPGLGALGGMNVFDPQAALAAATRERDEAERQRKKRIQEQAAARTKALNGVLKYGDTVKFISQYEAGSRFPLQVHCCPEEDAYHSTATMPSKSEGSRGVNIATNARKNSLETKWIILREDKTAGAADPVKYCDKFVIQSAHSAADYIITWGYGTGMGSTEAVASQGGSGVITAHGGWQGSGTNKFRAFRYSEYSAGRISCVDGVETTPPAPPIVYDTGGLTPSVSVFDPGPVVEKNMPYYGSVKSTTVKYKCLQGETVGCKNSQNQGVDYNSDVHCPVGSFVYCYTPGEKIKDQYLGGLATAKYRATHNEAVTSSLQAWAERVAARDAAAVEYAWCKEGAQNCYKRLKTPGLNTCGHKDLVWGDIYNNPILTNFTGATIKSHATAGPGNEGASNQSKIENNPLFTEKNPLGVGYLKIPTTSYSDPDTSWANRQQAKAAGGDIYRPGANNEYINMLIVRKFNSDESELLFRALDQSGAHITGSLARSGYNFIFTPEGHISFKIGDSDGSTALEGKQTTYYNNFIHGPWSHPKNEEPNARTLNTPEGSFPRTYSGKTIPDINTGAAAANNYTMDGNVKFYGVRKFSASNIHKPVTVLHAHSAKVVMNRTSTYILYTPADLVGERGGDFIDETTKISRVREKHYYLLYNPIHQPEFKKFYQALIQTGPHPNEHPTVFTKSSYGDPYYVPPQIIDPVGCDLPQISIPSYTEIVGKYCNAFQVEGMKTLFGPHSYSFHYADPLCAFIQNKVLARQCFLNNANLTPKSISEIHYLENPNTLGATAEDAYNNYLHEKSKSDAYGEFDDAHWGCNGHGPQNTEISPTIYQWMQEGQVGGADGQNMLGKYSRSFIKEFITAYLNQEDEKFIAAAPSPSGPRDIGRKTIAFKVDEAQPLPPACIKENKTINNCNAIVNPAGGIDNTVIMQYMECGKNPVRTGSGDGPPASSPPASSSQGCPECAGRTTGACADQTTCGQDQLPWHECKINGQVPPCSYWDEPEGSMPAGTVATWTARGNKGKKWTGCCLIDNGIQYMDCLQPIAATGKCDSVFHREWERDATPQPTSQYGHVTIYMNSLHGLWLKLDDLQDTVKALDSTYPNDPKIKGPTDDLSEQIQISLAEHKRLKDLEPIFSPSDLMPDFVTAKEDVGTLATTISDMEAEAKRILALVKAAYFKGIKKTYLYIGIAAIVLIILIILIL